MFDGKDDAEKIKPFVPILTSKIPSPDVMIVPNSQKWTSDNQTSSEMKDLHQKLTIQAEIVRNTFTNFAWLPKKKQQQNFDLNEIVLLSGQTDNRLSHDHFTQSAYIWNFWR